MKWIYKVHLGGYAVIILLLLITFTLGCNPQVDHGGSGRYATSSGGQVLDTHTGHVCSQRGIYDEVVAKLARLEAVVDPNPTIQTYILDTERTLSMPTFTCWNN